MERLESSRRVGSRGLAESLADAIRLAAAAGKWDVVMQLSGQLAELMRQAETPGILEASGQILWALHEV